MLGDPIESGPSLAADRPSAAPRLALPAWGPWGSLLGATLGVLVFYVTQALTLVGFLVIREVARPGGGFARPGWGGIVVLSGTVLASLMAVAWVALLVASRGWPVGPYLAWRAPSGRATGGALAILAPILAAALGLAIALDRPIITPTPADAAGGVPLGLVILAVAVALPAAEEVLFRGFLYRGLAESALGPGRAIGLSALAWAAFQALHQASQGLPVNLYSVACLYLFGLFLGLVRHLSGSLPLVVALHGLSSAASLAEAIFVPSLLDLMPRLLG